MSVSNVGAIIKDYPGCAVRLGSANIEMSGSLPLSETDSHPQYPSFLILNVTLKFA